MTANKQKVLGIFCHPDDEVLAGWPIFQSNEYEKHLIICCSDKERNRPNRKVALQEVCKQENINLVACLDEPNDFYALPTRRAEFQLTESVDAIEAWLGLAIYNIHPDFIMTHNPCGEYGHGSHRLLFEIVSQLKRNLKSEILITDICQKSNHRSHDEIPESVMRAYYTCLKRSYNLNYNFYNRCKLIYDKYSAWTWCYPPIDNCNLWVI